VPDDAAWADHVVVPDDLRDLQAEIDAYHRERRAERRARRWGWLTGTATWQRWSFPLGMLTGALALAALVFVLLAVESGPPPHHRIAASPLGTPPAAAGTKGGLLPELTLSSRPSGSSGATLRATRDLRPAVVALLPLSCRCTDLIDILATQAAKVGVPLHVVAPAPIDAEVSALAGRMPLQTWFDASGTLARTYAATGVTVLVVDPDGVVASITRDASVDFARTLPLQTLLVLPPTVRTG
jgi:hypothetical protein